MQAGGPLIVITVGAVAMPALARAIGIPVAVAEIAYGFAVGPTLLGLADPGDEFVKFLAELGFAFFLFLAGLEIDVSSIERRGARSLVVPVLVSVLGFGISVWACTALGWGLWVGLATGAISVPLLLSVIREAGLSGTPLGVEMLTVAAVGELVTIFFLTVVEVHHAAHGDAGLILAGLARLAGLCAAVVAVAVALRTLMWWYPAPFTQMVAAKDSAEFGVRVGFGLMFLFVGLAVAAGVEPFLGAFVAGAALAFVLREAGALEHKLGSMAYGFFVPVFFIHVGMRLELDLLLMATHGGTMALIVVVMFASKALPSLLMFTRGMAALDVLITASLLSAPLTLVIAIMDLGLRAGAVTPTLQAVVITGGILASLIFPSVARALVARRRVA